MIEKIELENIKIFFSNTYCGILSYVRTPAIAATMVTAIVDGDLLHGCNNNNNRK